MLLYCPPAVLCNRSNTSSIDIDVVKFYLRKQVMNNLCMWRFGADTPVILWSDSPLYIWNICTVLQSAKIVRKKHKIVSYLERDYAWIAMIVIILHYILCCLHTHSQGNNLCIVMCSLCPDSSEKHTENVWICFQERFQLNRAILISSSSTFAAALSLTGIISGQILTWYDQVVQAHLPTTSLEQAPIPPFVASFLCNLTHAVPRMTQHGPK